MSTTTLVATIASWLVLVAVTAACVIDNLRYTRRNRSPARELEKR